MNIQVEINIDGLPAEQNHHRLSVELEQEIQLAVARALTEAYEDGMRNKDWSVRVHSF